MERHQNPYLNVDAKVEKTRRGHLPHWHQNGKIQFVTFRLNDSLPAIQLAVLKDERQRFMQLHPQPWSEHVETAYYQRFEDRMDAFLQAGCGACWLRKPAVRREVEGVLHFYDGLKYTLYAYVVMPNHVHVLMEMADGEKCAAVVGDWKSYITRSVNKLRGCRGSLWQHESFDRLIRSKEDLRRKVYYIRHNGDKLPPDDYSVYVADFVEPLLS